MSYATANRGATAPADYAAKSGRLTLDKRNRTRTVRVLVVGDTRAEQDGDLQYEDGTLSKLGASYDPSWGRVKAITHPAPGNHEYQTAGAAGYFRYFGAAAGVPTKGYYASTSAVGT